MPNFLHRAYAAPIHCFVINFSGLAICSEALCEARVPSVIENTWFGNNHPSDTGDLGGDGNDGFVGVHPRLETVNPLPEPVSFPVEMRIA